jgi:hypothetical protein
MSYTTGSQTLQKSMNGIFTIEGDTISAITILADDITCDTLTVNSTSTFNGSVPTSTVTGIPSGTMIAPVNMLVNIFLAAVTGGYARLTTVDNTFTNNNTFDGSLISTTTQPVTTDSSTIVPTTNWIQDLLFTKIRVNANNSVSSGVSAGLTSQGTSAVALGYLAGEDTQGNNSVALGTSAGRTTQGLSSVAIGPLAALTAQGNGCVSIGNQTARLNQNDFSVALGQQAGYNALATNAIAVGYLASYSSSIANSICFNGTGAIFNPTQAGLFVKPLRGVSTGLIAGGLFYDSSTGELKYSTSTTNTLNASVATTISSPTTNINGTTCNISSTNLAVSTSTATTFVNLPSTTTTFTTATANQFITKNIGDTTYAKLASPTFTGTVTIPTLVLTNPVALPNNSTATTQPSTEASTNIATTAYVERADYYSNPLEIYFNVGVGGGSGLINLKRFNCDPAFAVTASIFSTLMNFDAIRLDQGVTYTGVTTYFAASPAGGLLQIGMYDVNGAILASTGIYTSVGTTGFHSLNFTTSYMPSTCAVVWLGVHIRVSTTTSHMATSGGGASAINCSPAPTTALCKGRSFQITKPATFPATINGLAKTANNFCHWYGVY